MLKRVIVPVLLAGTIMGAGLARAEPFSQMVAFSGALSDTGNFNAELGQDRPAPFYKNRSTKLSDEYTAQFNAMLDRIDDGSFTLIRWSFDDFVKDLLAEGERFGLTNATQACLDLKPEECDVNRFVYLTGEYPTARVHQMLGSAMALSILDRPKGMN